MSYTENELAKDLENQEYKFGFVTNIESDQAPKGLNEDIIRFISAKKEEPSWLLEYRLTAFRAWKEMTEPTWAPKRPGPIAKSVTITSNATNEPNKVVRIKGNVGPAPEGDSPVNNAGPKAN